MTRCDLGLDPYLRVVVCLPLVARPFIDREIVRRHTGFKSRLPFFIIIDLRGLFAEEGTGDSAKASKSYLDGAVSEFLLFETVATLATYSFIGHMVLHNSRHRSRHGSKNPCGW